MVFKPPVLAAFCRRHPSGSKAPWVRKGGGKSQLCPGPPLLLPWLGVGVQAPCYLHGVSCPLWPLLTTQEAGVTLLSLDDRSPASP